MGGPAPVRGDSSRVLAANANMSLRIFMRRRSSAFTWFDSASSILLRALSRASSDRVCSFTNSYCSS